jgi:hypothetical protein
MLLGSAAQAQTTTFASFNEKISSANNFTKSGNSFFTSTNGSTVTAIPIFFSFGVANGYEGNTDFGNPIAATLTLTSTVTGTSLTNINATFTANTAGLNGITNLLTLSTSSGTFSGSGSSGGISGSTPSDTVTFSSAALSFFNTTARNFGITLTSITPALSGGSGTVSDFQGSGSGSFASNPPPISTATGTAPEPGSLAMLGTGMLSMAGLVVRRRFKK